MTTFSLSGILAHMRTYSRNEIFAVLYRLVQAAAWFISGRLVILGAGERQYGFTSVMLSLAAWLQLFDFGVTSYLRTELPKAFASGGKSLAASYLKSALWSTTTTTGALLALMNIFMVMFSALPDFFISLLSSNSIVTRAEFTGVAGVLSLYALAVLCGNLTQAYLGALQKQYVYYLLSMVGCLCQPLATRLAISQHFHLDGIFFAFAMTPLIPGILYFLWMAVRLFPNTRRTPHFSSFNRTSVSYLVIQIGGAITSNLDLVLVSHYFGLQKAATYSIFKLIVQFPISIHAQFILQSWPVYSMLSTDPSQRARIKALFLRNGRIAGAGALVLCIALTAYGPRFVQLWSNGTLNATHITAFLFAVYGSMYMICSNFNVLMFAFNYTKRLLPFAIGAPICYVLLVWTLRRFGFDSVIFSNSIIYVYALGVGLLFYTHRIAHPA